jgi:hypothetical protein
MKDQNWVAGFVDFHMIRFTALMGLILLSACAASPAQAKPEFDVCLMTNMAAVNMLETQIEETEQFLTRARLTQDARFSLLSAAKRALGLGGVYSINNLIAPVCDR